MKCHLVLYMNISNICLNITFSSSNSFPFFFLKFFSFSSLCVFFRVSLYSVYLLSLKHIFRLLLLWWWIPWRALWWGWPFHLKWVYCRKHIGPKNLKTKRYITKVNSKYFCFDFILVSPAGLKWNRPFGMSHLQSWYYIFSFQIPFLKERKLKGKNHIESYYLYIFITEQDACKVLEFMDS